MTEFSMCLTPPLAAGDRLPCQLAHRALRCSASRQRATWFAAALMTTACSEKSTTPTTPNPLPVIAVASVTVSPASAAVLVGQSISLEATTKSATGAILAGRHITWSAGASAVATISSSTTGAVILITAIAPGTATFTATSEGQAAFATITVPNSGSTDFAIVDAQWTQGVQQANGGIPMVLDGNDAVVNVLVSASGTDRIAGQLVLTIPESTGVFIRADTVLLNNVQNGVVGYGEPTAQFLVPTSAIRAGMKWRVQRDPRRAVVDTDSTNDWYPRTAPATLATVSLPVLRMRFVPITLSAHGNVTGTVTSNNTSAYLPTLSRIVPYGQLSTSIGAPLTSSASFGTPPSGGGESFWLQVLSELDLARIADATTPSDTYWMGVVAPPSGFNNTSFGGFSYIPNSPTTTGAGTRTSLVVQTGWFNNTGQTSDLVAHELGHALGRRHTPCGNPSGVDPNYPTPNGSIGVIGHDVRSWAQRITGSALARAATMGDVMGYCFPQWASPYTYSGMLAARAASASSINIESASRSRQHVVVVRGTVDQQSIALLPTVTVSGFVTTPSTAPTALRVELADNAGRVIATQRVAPSEVDHSLVRTFVVAIPLSESQAATITSIRVVGANTTTIRRGTVQSAALGGSTPRENRNVASIANSEPQSILAPPSTAQSETAHSSSEQTLTVHCHAPSTQALVVQDHDSGEILASAPGNSLSFQASSARRVDITCSDGIRSVRAYQLTASRPSR